MAAAKIAKIATNPDEMKASPMTKDVEPVKDRRGG